MSFLDPYKEEDWDYLLEVLYNVKGKTPVVTEIAESTRDPFKVLISTVLSLRTKDEVTAVASKALFNRFPDAESLSKADIKEIEELIKPVGFYHVKARNIKEIARRIVEEFNGKVPNDLDILLTFKGVGRKTANLVLTEGFNLPGICVDTHVHRCLNRMGLVETKTPEQTEFFLRKVLPKRYWKVINTLLVSFGKEICRPISPLCSKCPLNERCPKLGVKRHR